MESVTENDMLALSARIHAAKAEWKEALRHRDHAHADYKKAEEDLSAAKKRFRSAVADLMAVAGAHEDAEMMWA